MRKPLTPEQKLRKKERDAIWRKNNPDKVSAMNKRAYNKNAEKRRQNRRDKYQEQKQEDGFLEKQNEIAKKNYHKKYRDTRLEYQKKYSEKNKSNIREYQKSWRKKNIENIRQYKNQYYKIRRKTDSDFKFYSTVMKHIRTITKRDEFIEVWDDVRMIYDMYGIKYNIDHLIPRTWFKTTTSKSIINHIDNLQVIDAHYNITKLNRWADPVPQEYLEIAKPHIKKDYLDKLLVKLT